MTKTINFAHENTSIIIPDSYNHRYFNLFAGRPIHEEKFRIIIAELISNNFISKNSNIIDLGAWIGDNALPWAKLLCDGVVYAIDPSKNNCLFIENLMELNNITNIEIYQEAISDKVEMLNYQKYAIDHINFNKTIASKDSSTLYTNYLDKLFLNEKNLGFIHLDVESMEYKVVLGAKNIIDQNRPIIAYECHINTDVWKNDIIVWFKNRDYNVYLINEILLDCNNDCRNFLTFPKNNDASSFINSLLPGILELQ